MRVVIINTSERTGGAAIAARRLMEALKGSGIKVKMIVRDKETDEVTVVQLRKSWRSIWCFLWERLMILKSNGLSRKNLFAVDIANMGTDITALPEFVQADVVHLHWINQGMLSLSGIRKILESGKPVVWTMHDQWPFTGICHYSGDCDKYTDECHNCPKLTHKHRFDLSNRVFRRKEKLYALAPMTFVACSRWLEGLARRSRLARGHRVTNIPNPINTRLYHPLDKGVVRERLGLPADRLLLLFSSAKITDKRKGLEYLVEACRLLAREHPELSRRLGIVMMGKDSDASAGLFPFPVYSLSYRSREKEIVDVYNSADLYVTPSLSDNLPNTIMEAMACGVPCVGFNIGGIPEMIDHLHNGYVAAYKSAGDLANGIHWSLTDGDYQSLSEGARRKVLSRYSEAAIAKLYINIYNGVTASDAQPIGG